MISLKAVLSYSILWSMNGRLLLLSVSTLFNIRGKKAKKSQGHFGFIFTAILSLHPRRKGLFWLLHALTLKLKPLLLTGSITHNTVCVHRWCLNVDGHCKQIQVQCRYVEVGVDSCLHHLATIRSECQLCVFLFVHKFTFLYRRGLHCTHVGSNISKIFIYFYTFRSKLFHHVLCLGALKCWKPLTVLLYVNPNELEVWAGTRRQESKGNLLAGWHAFVDDGIFSGHKWHLDTFTIMQLFIPLSPLSLQSLPTLPAVPLMLSIVLL